VLVVAMVAGGCGDDGVLFGGSDSTDAPVSSDATTSTAGDTTTVAETTTVTTAAPATTATSAPPSTTTTAAPLTTTTTAPAGPTAADTLAAFFAAAEDLNRRIRDAAAVFNAGFDEGAGTIDPGVGPVVDALDTTPLRNLIPGGLSSDLETAVLAVFADLDSRISALAGGVRNTEWGEVEWALDCLSNGGRSFDRYPADLAEARELAGREPPPTAAADSEAAGIVAVRLEAIHSMNWGCESCGGVEYDTPLSVDWAGRTIIGVEFEATYTGAGWDVVIAAC
jgi:hypothetical protein